MYIGRNFLWDIQPLDLEKQRGTRINKNIILYFNFSTVTLMWSWRAVVESLHIQRRLSGVGTAKGINFSQNSRSYIVLELPHDPHDHSLHYACFSLYLVYTNECLFSIGHCLHPCIAWFPAINLLILFRSGASVSYIHFVHHRSRQYI